MVDQNLVGLAGHVGSARLLQSDHAAPGGEHKSTKPTGARPKHRAESTPVVPAKDKVAGGYISLGSATRACWQSVDLAGAYMHLLNWRDAIYAKHR